MALFHKIALPLVCFLGHVLYGSASTHHSSLIKWVNHTLVSILDLEPVGGEMHTNITTYLARGIYHDSIDRNIQTGIIPGKLITKENGTGFSMRYGVNGQDLTTNDFEVLTYPKGIVSWIPGDKVSSLDEKVVGGFDPFSSELLYLCRFQHFNGTYQLLTPGKLTTTGDCLVPYWTEISTNGSYEVLVVNAYGKFLDA